jgi:hypothetical protein
MSSFISGQAPSSVSLDPSGGLTSCDSVLRLGEVVKHVFKCRKAGFEGGKSCGGGFGWAVRLV